MLKRVLWITAVSALLVALVHGVFIPVSWLQPVTGPLLEDRAVALSVERAALSLLPEPRLRLINATLTSTLTDQPLARAGLLTLTLQPWPDDKGRWFMTDSLMLKEAEVWVQQEAGEASNWSAWPRVPPRKRQKLTLPDHIFAQNTTINISNASIGKLTARIDQLQLFQDASQPSTLAVRLQHADLAGNLQSSAKIRSDDRGWQLTDLQAEFAGKALGFPWSLTLAAETLGQMTEDHDNSSAGSLRAAHLRLYARRDDDPDEHQAVFSANGVRFEAGDGRWIFRQAEWTYTHEKAEAWTFNATVDAATSRLGIQPATIPGSEGVPARAMGFSMRCGKGSKPAWVWSDGWFNWAEDIPNRTERPIQQKPDDNRKESARSTFVLTCNL